jgi:hypothetical protein
MIAALGLLLSACATPDQGRVVNAASSPLADLNIVHAEIPPVLLEAKQAPYAPAADSGCEALAAQVRALDVALGADLDAPAGAEPGLLERGSTVAGDEAVGALRGAAEGLIPYRSWVRRLTGAERYSRMVAAAIAAGGVRRAYLKGLGESRGCAAPAAPRPASAP